jgi:hypothetical protein
MIAFRPAAGFMPSKDARCWYRVCPTRDAALLAKRELVAADISYRCKKIAVGSAKPIGRAKRVNRIDPAWRGPVPKAIVITPIEDRSGGRRNWGAYYSKSADSCRHEPSCGNDTGVTTAPLGAGTMPSRHEFDHVPDDLGQTP